MINRSYFLLRPMAGVQIIAISVSVCTYVCLSVRSHISKITSPSYSDQYHSYYYLLLPTDAPVKLGKL